MAKKFYWLKQKSDFFRNAKIKKLRKIAGGDTYTIIYQKMMLLSITNNGVIPYQGIEPTFHEELALELDESEDNVQATLIYMEAQGLIEDIGSNNYLLAQVVDIIGSESDSAERVRKLRAKKKSEELIETTVEPKALQCNTSVTSCNTEIERREKREENILTKKVRTKKAFEHDFDLFWSEYPKKKSKQTAKKAFEKNHKAMPDINSLIKIIHKLKESKEWAKEGGQYIPYPASWINAHGWDDEIESSIANNNSFGGFDLSQYNG